MLKETYRPLVLARKVKRLQHREMGRMNTHLIVAALPHENSGPNVLRASIIRPLRLLLTCPVVLLPALGLAVIFGMMFLMLSTMSTVYQQVYGWSTGASGLPYLGLGFGLFLGLGVYAVTADRVYRRLTSSARNNTTAISPQETITTTTSDTNPTPEMRLAPITLGAPLAAVGLIIYGWSFEKQLHWFLPIVGCVVFCQGMVAFMMPVTTYLIDAFPNRAAGPVGAASVLRCLAAGLLPLCADRLYVDLGYGWGNTTLALIALAFAPFPYLFYKNGERLRNQFPVRD